MRGITAAIFLNVLLFLVVVRTSFCTSKFRGEFPPAFTPFKCNGDLNLGVIPTYAQHLSKNGVYGVLVAGTLGEGLTLNVTERMLLLDAWLEAARPLNITVILQVGGLPFRRVCALAKYAESKGVDAIMTLPAIYYSPTTAVELTAYMCKVASCAPNTPLFYYDSVLSGVEIDMVEFFKIVTRKVPTFAGMKCRLETGISVRANVGLNKLSILSLTDSDISGAYLAGMNGTVSGIANLYPKLVSSLIKDARNGRCQSAAKKQFQLNSRLAAISLYNNFEETPRALSQLKAAMRLTTVVDTGPVRVPLPKVSPETERKMAEYLKKAGSQICRSC